MAGVQGESMVAVPVSARWMSGLGVGAFLLPLVSVVAGSGQGVVSAFGLLCVLLGVMPCAVPPFFRRRDHFRVACAAAGMTVAAVSLPTGLFGVMAALFVGGWLSYLTLLALLALPATAIAGLIAGFQRARGGECGRRAAVVAWVFTAVTVIGWTYLAVRALTWERPFASHSS
ncbi:hypothetical protein [Streptomyces sp. CBMA156]|uniref:hypothetical protein n=1 Tax=Streptomyces sp. CBMA156 TaxID=1930280 RepID=UPI001661D8D1|nr:hypothetical protein [Streptomyces sp. CBMA156]MBD0672127.1 hypothetical protein [Streptomyces sp. CBMA156]